MSKSKFVKYEEWEDYWYFKPLELIKLEKFETLNADSWNPSQNTIKFIIESQKETSEPTDRQLTTVQYVKDNQDQILNSIFEFHQAFIFPLFKAHIDIEEHQILSDISQTNIIYSIESIQIPILHKANSNYFILNFNFAFDDEHNISFLFKNLSIIDFVGSGDDFIDYIELYENKLEKGNKELSISIYDHPNKEAIFRGKTSFNDKIDYTFENKPYTVGIQRNEWPRNFRVFIFPSESKTRISVEEILNTS